MADAGVDEIKLREVQRELQRKIDKAKPVVSQHDAGELKVLSDAQQRMVDAYPGYLADMAEVKAGRMPAVRAAKPQPKQASASAEADGAADDDSGKTGKQLKRERAAARKAAKDGGAKGTPSKGKKAGGGAAEPSAPLSEHDRFVHSVAKATGATRKALIDSFVSGKVNRSRLVELEREYDAVCQLRREILSGSIAQPTKLQQSKVQLAEALKHDVEAEQSALRSQGDRHRILLMAEVEELEAQPQPAEDEADSMTESPPPEEAEGAAVDPKAEAEEAPKAEEEEEPADAEPEAEKEDAPVAAQVEKEEQAAEEEAAAETAESVASEPKAEDKAEAEVAAPSAEEPVAEAEEDAEIAAVAEAAEEAEEEPTKDPTPPPPPAPRTPTPPPKPIDWNEVVITKNRRTIAAPNKRGASPVDASRRDRSASPAAVAARSPTDAAPAKPTTMPSLMYTAAESATSAPAKAAASPKKGGKPPVASAFRQSAAARLQREFVECAAAQATLPAVACALVGDDVFRWAVNVAVADGPLVGLVVPLEVVFSDFYPQEAPLIKALVEVPHPSIVPSAGARNSLCLEHTATINPKDVTPMRGWSPAYGAFSVLSQLQGFFAKENFAKLEKTLGAKVFAGRIRTTRIAIANFASAATGHTPARPVPAVPMLNGPLRHAPEGVLLRAGAIRCRAAGEGNVWQHAYGRDGVHRFRATLRGGSAVIGVTVDGDQADQSKLGKVDGSWAFDTATGSLWAEGKQTAAADEAGQYFPLPAGATVDVTVQPKEGTITFAAHGEAFVREVTGIETTGPFIPAYCLLSAQSATELAFYVAGTTVPPPSSYASNDAGNSGADATDAPSSSEGSPNAPAPAAAMAGDARASPRCAVSLRGANEGALICLGIEVSKRHRTHLPAEMHATASYVAHECFGKVSGQRAPSGYRYDVALPLLLDAEHSKRALPQLKKTLTHMCRNPLASTLYDPPFRPQLACAIFAELLRGVIRDVLHSRSPDHAEAFVLYCRLVHGFAALAAETPAIVKEARGTIAMGECSATVVFAVSTVVVEEPWPEIVSRAIRAEFGGREPETDAEGFALLKRALPKLLIGGAMARAVRFASLPRAVEVLASNAGAPSDEIAAEALGAIASRGSVDSWEAMCDFFGVSTSAADVAAV